MMMATSIHWHGLIVPNRYDGVSYLTSPPIGPMQTYVAKFPIVQSGTYWYHSHTMLQEQTGCMGRSSFIRGGGRKFRGGRMGPTDEGIYRIAE
jgi:FtsP/CotA-like multicopper oxidase with cupredoxin domain